MVSTIKAVTSLLVSSSIIVYYYISVHQLSDLMYLQPILVLYCMLDLNNSRDMILHHVATILLNINLLYVNQNLSKLKPIDQPSVFQITSAFFLVETSTIWLSLLHLKCRNVFFQMMFIASFIYYRIIYLPYLLWNKYQYHFIDAVCEKDMICRNSWYFGSGTLIGLNFYWLCIILFKMCRKIKKHRPKQL